MKQEDIKELMELCGWEWKEFYDSGYSSYSWKISFKDVTEAPFGAHLPEDFVPDLNFLFKYATPKVVEKCGYETAYKMLIKWINNLNLDREENPADTLAQAILGALRK